MIPGLAISVVMDPKQEAAGRVGVHPMTLRRWLRRGREEPESVYGRLVRAVEELEASSPGPLSEPELVVLLERQARKGHVRAIELLLQRPWQRKQEPAVSGSKIDELASRRARRA